MAGFDYEAEGSSTNTVAYRPTRQAPKSVCLAWILWLPPFGLLGFHRMYVHQWAIGIYYLLTGGNFGIGWLLDICRINGLVKEINRSDNGRVPLHPFDMFITSLPPMGLLGGARAYLGYPVHGAMYFLTAGGAGLMWFLDLFRTPCLYSTAKHLEQRQYEEQLTDSVPHKRPVSLLEAYLLLLVCPVIGLLGGHRFYLGHIWTGLLYFFTGGVFGFGYLYDVVALYWVVEWENNRRLAFSGDIEQIHFSEYSGDLSTESAASPYPQAMQSIPYAFSVAVPEGYTSDARLSNI